jgi:hypothetical protein
MSQPLRIDCPSASDLPPADRLRELATDDHHVVLRFPAEELAAPQGGRKRALVEQLASVLPEFSVFDSGGSSGTECITIKKVIRREDVLTNTAEFVAALRLFRRTASALAVRLAQRLGVAPDRLLDLDRQRDRAEGLGRLDGGWAYHFHGLECCFENRESGQAVEVRLGFGDEFGVLDPYFFGRFVKSTPGLAPLARLIQDDFHDAARVLDVLQGGATCGWWRADSEAGWWSETRVTALPEGDAMTEQEWRSCSDPAAMLEFLRTSGKLSDRKARLFAVACCRRIWPLLTDERSRRAVEVAERYADGLASSEQLESARRAAKEPWMATNLTPEAPREALRAAVDVAYRDEALGAPPHAAVAEVWEVARPQWAAWVSLEATAPYTAREAALQVHPYARRAAQAFQANVIRDLFGPLPFRPVALDPSWRTPEVVALATAVYDQRSFDRMPELAYALEEAGCDNEEVLSHLLQQGVVHVRGCWVIDLLLGKESRV